MRALFLFVLVPLILLAMVATDPAVGLIKDIPPAYAVLSAMFVYLGRILIFVYLFHIARRLLLSYKDSRIHTLLLTAKNTPTGAGLAVIGLGLFSIGISIVMAAAIISG